QVKQLYVAAAFVNRAAHHQANTPGNGPKEYRPPNNANGLTRRELLEQIEHAILDLKDDESVALTNGYLEGGYKREPLVQLLATAASKIGNDPHNQELGLCLVEDYLHSTV